MSDQKNRRPCTNCQQWFDKDDMVSKVDTSSIGGKAYFCSDCEKVSGDYILDQSAVSKCQECQKFQPRRDMFCLPSLNPERDGCKYLAWCCDHLPTAETMPYKELGSLKPDSKAYKDAESSYRRAVLKRAKPEIEIL